MVIFAYSKQFPCPAGKNHSIDTCQNCTTGYKQENDECIPCNFGKYWSDFECKVCEAGKFSNASTGTSCHVCKNNTFSSTNQSVLCKKCPDGTISNSNRTNCVPNVTMHHNDEYNISLRCMLGNHEVMHALINIYVGEYKNGDFFILNASSSEYTLEMNKETLKFKNASFSWNGSSNNGIHYSNTNNQECNYSYITAIPTICDPGNYARRVYGGIHACVMCPVNTYKANTTTSYRDCLSCENGKYSDIGSDHANNCKPCDNNNVQYKLSNLNMLVKYFPLSAW